MHSFVRHKDQEGVSDCLTAILQLAETSTMTCPHGPRWPNGHMVESLSLSLCLPVSRAGDRYDKRP